MLHFIDFEVFKHDWLCVIINPINREKTVIVNDQARLEEYFENHKREIFIGYNIRKYDQYIFKAILCGFNPKEVNDFIIVDNKDGWRFSDLFRKIPLIFYDVMPQPPVGLKTLEGFMGSDICETTVPFDIDRKLTTEEINETIFYCTHDVEQTIEVFIQRKNEFDAIMGLIKEFNLPLENVKKTKAQLSALILECTKQERNDEWDIQFVPCLDIKKYSYIVSWFKNTENRSYDKNLETTVCGIPHVFGWGGLHGAPEKPIHRKGLILHVDVNSFYPSIMIEWNMLTRNAKKPEKFKEIYEKRLALKRAGKKAEQAPLKIVLNATYGITKDKFSTAYDPRQANNICVNGQLLLLDLLEHLEGYCDVLNVNTDGLIIQIPDTDVAFEKIDDICYEWEKRTKMGLGLDVIQELWQKDVNNYIFKDDKGKLDRKGAYVKELNYLDYDLPIINRALVDYMLNGTPIEKTILDTTDLRDFQKIVKLSDKYKWVEHEQGTTTIKYDNKAYRVFASTDSKDGRLLKCDGIRNPAKFGNTPDKCFIFNESLEGVSIPKKLDYEYYIDLAKKRLNDFGVYT